VPARGCLVADLRQPLQWCDGSVEEVDLREEERLGVGRVLELVVVLVGLACEVAEDRVYLAVGQPAFALFSTSVEVGEASADDECPDVVRVLG
jgi:hypothetical protein